MGTLTLFVTVFALIYGTCPLVQSERRVGLRSLGDNPRPSDGQIGTSGNIHTSGQIPSDGGQHGSHGNCDNNHCEYGVCVPDLRRNPNHNHYTCDCYDGYIGKHCDEQITQAPTVNHHNYHTSTETITTTTPPSATQPSTTTMQTTTTPAPTTVKITTDTPTTTTTTSSATVTTTAQITQAPVQLHEVVCGKLSTVSDIANRVQASNQLAIACASGNHTSPEAFTLNNCPLAIPAFWKKGANVMNTCSSLPMYTPIAEFGTADYVSSPSSLSGVFLGCDGQPEGFKIAVQKCDSIPHIEHVDVGGSNDPHSFFVIKY